MTHAYGEPSYWDQRYQSDPGTFDWYQKYPSLAPLFDRYLLRHHRLLLVGCGNSGILTLHPVFLLGSTHICHRFERIHLRNKLISGWTLRPSSPDPVLRTLDSLMVLSCSVDMMQCKMQLRCYWRLTGKIV
ncbi:hypothetical protein BHE74_00054091 [Ensete ventricosum]|nr:hypothetical protein GW17_00010757 [Ensete ventricosum]RWW40495.1 hypothetical protein BHE74_00054091 [Ensete ventricosum]